METIGVEQKRFRRAMQAIKTYRRIYNIENQYESLETSFRHNFRKAFTPDGKRLIAGEEISRILNLHEDSFKQAITGNSRVRGEFVTKAYLRKLMYLVKTSTYSNLDKNEAYDAIFEYADRQGYGIATPSMSEMT